MKALVIKGDWLETKKWIDNLLIHCFDIEIVKISQVVLFQQTVYTDAIIMTTIIYNDPPKGTKKTL